jgi:hypothetical protein
MLTNHEEGTAGLMAFQKVQKLRSVLRVRSIIESQSRYWVIRSDVGDGPQDAALCAGTDPAKKACEALHRLLDQNFS